MQAELIRDLGRSHGVGKVLLVGIHEHRCVAKIVVLEHFVELVACSFDPVPVVGIYNVDQAVGVEIVVAPKLSDFVLPSHWEMNTAFGIESHG
jgi:hypothetical protein